MFRKWVIMFNIGKQKCKALREIRRQIAKENNIEFNTSDCKYKGTCSGTCPKCDAELLYLNSELEKRKNLGKSVIIDDKQMSKSFLENKLFQKQRKYNAYGGDFIQPDLVCAIRGDMQLLEKPDENDEALKRLIEIDNALKKK